MKTSSKILAAVAAAVTAGFVLGILFAPDKGSETRRKLHDEGKKLADELKDNILKGKGKLSEMTDKIKQDVQEKMEGFV